MFEDFDRYMGFLYSTSLQKIDIWDRCIEILLCFLKKSILVCITWNWRHKMAKMKYVFLDKCWHFSHL